MLTFAWQLHFLMPPAHLHFPVWDNGTLFPVESRSLILSLLLSASCEATCLTGMTSSSFLVLPCLFILSCHYLYASSHHTCLKSFLLTDPVGNKSKDFHRLSLVLALQKLFVTCLWIKIKFHSIQFYSITNSINIFIGIFDYEYMLKPLAHSPLISMCHSFSWFQNGKQMKIKKSKADSISLTDTSNI